MFLIHRKSEPALVSCKASSEFSVSSHLEHSWNMMWKGKHLKQTCTCKYSPELEDKAVRQGSFFWTISSSNCSSHKGSLSYSMKPHNILVSLLCFCHIFATVEKCANKYKIILNTHSSLTEIVPLFVFVHLDCKFHLLHHVLIIIFYFQVITTGNPVLDYETMPKSFDLQIFVEDTTGRTDLNVLTIHVTDKNEHPVFRGNMAIQSKMMVELKRTILENMTST